MKRTPVTLLTFALVALMTLSMLPTQQPASAAQNEKGNDALHEAMVQLAGNYKQVRKQMKDASLNADTADKLAAMTAAAIHAKSIIPETATNDELKKTYRVLMNKLIAVLSEAENAALAGEQDKLAELVLAANTVKGEGHELFLKED